ncbi:MAG: hypothetical protein KBT22_12320 [Bacteroidales bacterium]|nr:hypothetical protein [Candidatus Scybalocola fimicaballi]
MKHKHFIGELLLASSVLFSFSSCLDENDDEFKKQEEERKQQEAFWSTINKITVSGQVDGHTYVDLGLPSGIKWATCNVGATTEFEFGDYFSWGETSSKEKYDITTYKWVDEDEHKSHTFTKYNSDEGYGIVDNKTTLDPEDDAATANWGEKWRTPTAEEMEELLRNCEWNVATTFGGTEVAGLVCVSKINNNVIFFPAGGERPDFGQSFPGGHYWTSTLGDNFNSPRNSKYWCFGVNHFDITEFDRCIGKNVRAVTK